MAAVTICSDFGAQENKVCHCFPLFSDQILYPLNSWYLITLASLQQESCQVGLKLSIQETKIIASSPITSGQIDGETVTDFIFGGFKITADGNCSHEIKTLAPWKKSYDQPRQHIKKQRHYQQKSV